MDSGVFLHMYAGMSKIKHCIKRNLVVQTGFLFYNSYIAW